MRLLFAITVCSFCAVLWVALALARRIQRGQRYPLGTVRRPSARHVEARRSATQEFFEAGEFRTPRPLRLDQEIFQQRPRRALAEITFAHETTVPAAYHPVSALRLPVLNSPQPNIQRTRTPIPIRSATAYASLFGQTVPIARIDQHLYAASSQNSISASNPAIPKAEPASLPAPISLRRKPPQRTLHSGLRHRVDLSPYNQDMGDLPAPYTHSVRGSGTDGTVPADRTNR